MADDAESTQYCVCQQVDSGIMIECIRGTGGCHGWVHPKCCGLALTQEELEAMDSYICPLCESPTDDFSKMKALNTRLANKLAKKERKRKLQAASMSSTTSTASSSSAWKCKACAHVNTERGAKECAACHHPRRTKSSSSSSSSAKDKGKKKKSTTATDAAEKGDDGRAQGGRAHREAKAKHKSYHVPNSDEDLSDHEPDATKRKSKKRPRENDGAGSESDEAEFQIDLSKKSKKDEVVPAVPAMVIEKIMGARKRDGLDDVMEYYIKWNGFSHMHCTWETQDVLLDIDMNNKMRLKRFHEKDQQHLLHKSVSEGMEDGELEYFNPEYLELHRIIAHRQETPMPPDPAFPDAPVDDGMRYLVKWRVLPYSEATWERACDLKDDSAIEKYTKALVVPPKETWEPPPRPTIREYRKLEESPAFGEDGSLRLREYQLEGLNWLLWNWYNERPSVLADEMGLGKTIQTLAFLDRLRFSDKIRCRGPFLVVAPLSLIAQWQSECETWTSMNCIVYHGNTESREVIRQREFYYVSHDNKPDKKKPFRFNILVTTYEVAIKDISFLSKIRWRCLVVDEAHRLKNQSSRLVEQLRSLRRDHCVLLTGTPLQNKTEELWALLNFLDAKSFPSVNDFLEKFGDLHESQQVADLHKMLKPYLLRRVKEDVEKSLPPKEETIIEVELTPVQKQWYRAIYEKNTTFLSRGGNPNNMPNLMNVMMELRKCCNHPYLNNGVEDILNEGLQNDAQRHEMMVKCCGKMVLLDKLLPRLKEGGHKVLIFSQMVRVLDIIEDYLRYVGYVYERLDGNIRGNDRQAAVDRFVKPEYNRFVMLLSTKAGGLGLNLTAADTVIIFDSDWNPQNDLQAQARAHRIGQTHSVKIYRLITRKTYEMHMFHKASLKLGLDKAVLTHMRRENEEQKEGKTGKTKKSKAQESKEIDELLKRGAYDVFRDEDEAAEQFCAADIDSILQRSSQIVQYEQQARSSFSKASFVSATTSDDVDIDDPDFWKKAVGLTEPDVAESADNLPMQRKRTRVSRFGTSGQIDSDGEEEENERKEKEAEKEREREKEEREKAEEKKEPRDWTLNGRDRLQRALMHFGFGRWEIIRGQSGGSRSIEEVEQFAREFLYVTGLSCADANPSKDDSPFIKAVIRTAVHANKENLVNSEELPPVLKDEDFILKLKQGGGRRVLIRLDMLLRLKQIISNACDTLDEAYYAKKNSEGEAPKETDGEAPENTSDPPPADADVDARVKYHGVVNVANSIDLMDLGDRPSWTLITPWWDREADRSLLIGVFLHGYGRCTQIITDPRLCFTKLQQGTKNAASGDGDNKEQQSNGKPEKEKDADKKDQEDMEMSDAAESDVEDNGSVTGEEDGDDPKTATPSATAKKESTPNKKFKLPEVQQMNRLLFWLLSADDIKRQKEQENYKRERVGIEQQRQASMEKKQRVAALHRVEMKAKQLAQMDMFRQLANVHNALQIPASQLPPPSQKLKQREWSKDERRSFSYMIAMYGAPRILAKSAVSSASGEGAAGFPAFAWQTDSVSWLNIVKWGKLNKTAMLAREYFETKFLPKCREIAAMKVDPLGTDNRAAALADLIGMEFVDAQEGVLAHGLKARNMSWVALRRIQLLEDILEVLSDKRPELLTYLQSGDAKLVQDMPAWWCPWVHDLGLFYGMAKYGIYGWERILLDRQLPFHRRARADFIRSYLLEGTPAFEPLFRSRFENQTSMLRWFEEAMSTFPSLAVLEKKMHAMCRDLLHAEMEVSDRYHEPEERSVYSFPDANNAVEEYILAVVKKKDEAVDDNRQLHLGSASGTLEEFIAESQARREEFVRAEQQAAAVNNGALPIQRLVS
ncbi:TPA: hypothetical protein N0F65_007938 [Lagenidium giganteum]|uniref:Uncharacterized protein n=1 Tax=Lagenidium giganteum TaxID=4803 RepID=A0AAV2YL94_9STRA|nr:TPA: hypothetical protein N0F65_007938 [Lagenidium giganteum]